MVSNLPKRKIRGPLLASKSCGDEKSVVIGFLEDDERFLDLRATRWKVKLPMGPVFDRGDVIEIEDQRYLVEMFEALPPFNLRDLPSLREAATTEGFMILGDEVYGFSYFLSKWGGCKSGK